MTIFDKNATRFELNNDQKENWKTKNETPHIEHSSAFSGQDKQDSTRYCNYVHILGQ